MVTNVSVTEPFASLNSLGERIPSRDQPTMHQIQVVGQQQGR